MLHPGLYLFTFAVNTEIVFERQRNPDFQFADYRLQLPIETKHIKAFQIETKLEAWLEFESQVVYPFDFH